MSQGLVFDVLVAARVEGEGWMTAKMIHERLSDRSPGVKRVRQVVARLVLYNFLDVRPRSFTVREVRIKASHLPATAPSRFHTESTSTNYTAYTHEDARRSGKSIGDKNV